MTKLEEAFIKVHWFKKYFQSKRAVKKQLFLKKLTFAYFFQLLKIETCLRFQHNVEFVFSTCYTLHIKRYFSKSCIK